MATQEVLSQEIEQYRKPEVQPTPMDLLGVALQNNAAIDVIERLAALQEKALMRDAESQFNDAMNAAQSELGRIAPDLNNPQTHSKYASYAALDKVLRPIYTRHGFSLSFDCGECPVAESVLVLCYVSHNGGHTRTYRTPPMPADGKGAKGGDVMSKTHATGAAMSYGMRYLLKLIFNVAIGELDNDGNSAPDPGALAEHIEWIMNASSVDELRKMYDQAKAAFKNNQRAIGAIVAAKDARKKELA